MTCKERRNCLQDDLKRGGKRGIKGEVKRRREKGRGRRKEGKDEAEGEGWDGAGVGVVGGDALLRADLQKSGTFFFFFFFCSFSFFIVIIR